MNYRATLSLVVVLLSTGSCRVKDDRPGMEHSLSVPQDAAREASVPQENEILLERTFDAPRERVFNAFTRADEMTQWMKPSAMALVGCEVDLRVGGQLRYVFERPNGRKIEVRGVFEEVRAPSYFSYVETYDFSPLRIHVTVELQALGERTVYRQRLVYSSKAERDEDYPGVAQSSEEIFVNLERYLTKGAK